MNLFKRIRQTVGPYRKNVGGWSTSRKLVVIESDDWGSIRMPSRDVYEKCLKAGYRVDTNAYEKYDSLASEEDLENLFNLLLSFHDEHGHHPVFTANVLTANPDFEKIENSGFETYHYEKIPETFRRYPAHSRCLNLWKSGMDEKIFFPQSHGREHLNVSLFLNKLKRGDRDVRFGFSHRMPGCIPRRIVGGNEYVETLRITDDKDKQQKLKILLEGLDLFENLFGYRSRSFTPPNYLWSPDYNGPMSECDIKYYQGVRKMKEPVDGPEVKFNSHKLGEKNPFNQLYLVRNVSFEPSILEHNREKAVDQCLWEIGAAFRMRKPAVICSHRLNYVGYVDLANRDRNLTLLKELLKRMMKNWPGIEFITSVELGELIDQEKK